MTHTEPFVTLDELVNSLDYELDDLERKAAESALKDASALARFYGMDWEVAFVPPVVKVIVLNAVRRYMKLIDGYTMSRSGDETVQWTDMAEKTGTVFFTETEQQQIKDCAGRKRTFWSCGVFAYNNRRAEDTRQLGWAPWSDMDRPFPLFGGGRR